MNESFLPQGEEKKAKDFRLPCSRYDAPAIENWLTEKSKDGWRIYAWTDNAIKPNFTRSEQHEEHYWVEPAWEDAAPTQEERERHEMLGWEFVCRSYDGVYYIWRAAASGAHKSRPKPMEDSYAYREIKKKLRNSYRWFVVWIIAVAFLLYWLVFRVNTPVWTAVTAPATAKNVLNLLSIFASCSVALLADRRDRKALRRFKVSLRDGELMKSVGREKLVRRILALLPPIVSCFILLEIIICNGDDSFYRQLAYSEDVIPFVSAEMLGGESGETRMELRRTLLGGEITLVSEGEYAGWTKRSRWVTYSTQLEVYEPQLRFLAKPLADDVYVQHFEHCTVETLDREDVKKAYYFRDQSNGTQQLLLYDDGIVLYYRTDAPDDLRQHIDRFAAIMETRQKTS